MEVYIIIFLAILVLISTFISTKGSLTDDRKNGIKNFTRNGWKLVITNLFIIVLLVVQYYLNEYKLNIQYINNQTSQEIRDSVLKSRYDSSLLIIKSKFDSSNIKTISTVTDILGKYGFLLDSTNKVLVEVIKDSANVNIILPEDPVIKCTSIELSSVTSDTTCFNFDFTSFDAGSTGFNFIVTCVLLDTTGNYSIEYRDNFLTYNFKFSKNMTKFVHLYLLNIEKYLCIYIHLKGSYMNTDQSKIYQIDDVYFYDLKTKKFGEVQGEIFQTIIGIT